MKFSVNRLFAFTTTLILVVSLGLETQSAAEVKEFDFSYGKLSKNTNLPLGTVEQDIDIYPFRVELGLPSYDKFQTIEDFAQFCKSYVVSKSPELVVDPKRVHIVGEKVSATFVGCLFEPNEQKDSYGELTFDGQHYSYSMHVSQLTADEVAEILIPISEGNKWADDSIRFFQNPDNYDGPPLVAQTLEGNLEPEWVGVLLLVAEGRVFDVVNRNPVRTDFQMPLSMYGDFEK